MGFATRKLYRVSKRAIEKGQVTHIRVDEIHLDTRLPGRVGTSAAREQEERRAHRHDGDEPRGPAHSRDPITSIVINASGHATATGHRHVRSCERPTLKISCESWSTSSQDPQLISYLRPQIGLNASGRVITVDADRASLIAGWDPDETFWLTDIGVHGEVTNWARRSDDVWEPVE